jgi:hypothetical protein
VDQKEALPAGDLLVGMPGATLDSADGAVRVRFRSNFDDLSPYPSRETAVKLQPAAHGDLGLLFDRGRLELINRKESGAAQVHIQVRNDTWDLTLAEPGTRIALELYSRWPRGVRFAKEPDPKHVPTASLIFLVLQGQVSLEHGGFAHTMKAPPGPAMIEWDSVTGQDAAPQRLDKLPAWAVTQAKDSPQAAMRKEILERFRQTVADKGLDATLDQFLNSDKPVDRILAIYVLTALDDLGRLAPALREAKNPEIWEHGILALRAWIGRGPGQDQLLYNALIDVGKFTPVHARTVLNGLHSFGDEDLARPELYQALIDYLEHEKLIIRALAAWHLERLAPAGKKFGYNPADAPEKRAEAVAKWRELIPPGTIPAQPGVDAAKPSVPETSK